MPKIYVLFGMLLITLAAMANDEHAPSKPIKKPAAKEESASGKDGKAKDAKSAEAAKLKEEQAADELAAKIAEKLAAIRKEKEEVAKKPPPKTYAPPVRRPIDGFEAKPKVVFRGNTTNDPHASNLPAAGNAANSANSAAHSKQSGHEIHWGYEGEGGPLNWGKLSPANVKCDSGDRQSPIDIRDGIKVELDPISFDYKMTRFSVIDNGHTIQVNLAPGNYINVSGRNYELLQFHFHKPSEERINGKSFEMVAHFVHRDSDGKLAVVALLFERGKSNAILQNVWNNLPLEKYEAVQALNALDLNQILPQKKDYFTYMGSLTTPPCSEGVLWLVMKEVIPISSEQLSIFNRLYPMNARPLQKSSGRVIKESN